MISHKQILYNSISQSASLTAPLISFIMTQRFLWPRDTLLACGMSPWLIYSTSWSTVGRLLIVLIVSYVYLVLWH